MKPRVQRTIRLESKLNWLLTYVAMLRGKSTNNVLSEILREALPTELESLEAEITGNNPRDFRMSELDLLRKLLKEHGRFEEANET